MLKRKPAAIGLSVAIALLVLCLVGNAIAQVSANFDLSVFTFASGGGIRQSANYTIEDTLGQWTSDTAASSQARVAGGFVQANATATPTRSANTDPSIPTPTPTPVPDTYENDNVCDLAQLLAANGSAQNHTFHAPGDIDWVRFDPEAGTKYRIEVQIPGDSLADVNLDVYPTCAATANLSWQETFTPGVRLELEATDTNPIYLKVANADPALAGEKAGYQITVGKLQAATAETGAAIIVAGRLRATDRLQSNIHTVTNAMYKLFIDAGYGDDKIFYLATDDTLAGYDAPATVENLRSAITAWALDKLGPEKMLTIYLIDHGEVDRLYLDGVNGQQLTPEELNGWLTQLESTVGNDVKINVIIEACNAGSFIEGSTIAGPGRVIVTSTTAQNVAYASTSGAYFSDQFLTALRQGHHIFGGYWEAQAALKRAAQGQQPWLDDDGNGVANQFDGAEAAKRYLVYTDNRPDLDLWPPFVARVEQSTTLVDGTATIRAEVRDNKQVEKVWAVIYPPSYRPPTSSQELTPELPIVDLSRQEGDFYTLTYPNFTEYGLYRVTIYATDPAGLTARPATLLVNTGSILYLPMIRR